MRNRLAFHLGSAKIHSTTGPNVGKVVDREYFRKLLSMYYQRRGWDENGISPGGVENKFED